MISIKYDRWFLFRRTYLLPLVYQIQAGSCEQVVRPCLDRCSSPVHVKMPHECGLRMKVKSSSRVEACLFVAGSTV